jgi:hypothetical protein
MSTATTRKKMEDGVTLAAYMWVVELGRREQRIDVAGERIGVCIIE